MLKISISENETKRELVLEGKLIEPWTNELKIAGQVQTADVSGADTVKVFTVRVAAGPADLEATLLDLDGKPLCSAFYVTISKTEETK